MITSDTIRQIASLSNLSLTEEEIKQYEKEFIDVLEAFSVLEQCPADNDPLHVTSAQLREDIPKSSLKQSEALSFSKETEDGYFIGPKTTE